MFYIFISDLNIFHLTHLGIFRHQGQISSIISRFSLLQFTPGLFSDIRPNMFLLLYISVIFNNIAQNNGQCQCQWHIHTRWSLHLIQSGSFHDFEHTLTLSRLSQDGPVIIFALLCLCDFCVLLFFAICTLLFTIFTFLFTI